MFKKIFRSIAKVANDYLPVILFVGMWILSAYALVSVDHLNKRVTLLEERVSTIEDTSIKQFSDIQNTLLSINAHLELLDKYASADWEHFYGIQNNINVESKTKRK